MPYKSFGFTDHQLMIRDTIIGLMERELPPEKIEALEKASPDKPSSSSSHPNLGTTDTLAAFSKH